MAVLVGNDDLHVHNVAALCADFQMDVGLRGKSAGRMSIPDKPAPEREKREPLRCLRPHHCPEMVNGVKCNSHPNYSRTKLLPENLTLFECYYGHTWKEPTR